MSNKAELPGVRRLRKLPLWKRALFSLVTLVFSLLVLEGAIRLGMPWSMHTLHAEQGVLAQSGRGEESAREVLHPYFGWTLNPQTDPGLEIDGERIPVNRWGFIDKGNSVRKRSPERVIVGIFGGSVAQEFSFLGERRLGELLAGDPRFAGRELVVVHLAKSGFKQPQQLMLLNYLFSLGAEFDYVLNIDGFNDVVLTNTDHMHLGLHYTYPSYWHVRLQDVVDPRKTSISYRLLGIRARRQSLAVAAVGSPLRGSALSCVVWKLRDSRLRAQIFDLGMEVVSNNDLLGRGYPISGPESEFESEEAAKRAVVDFWKHGSWQMSVLCASRGTRYVHFLQPNQYLPDSKTLTAEELEDCYDPENALRFAVEENYPRMFREQKWFEERGVRFVDLTQVFRDEPRTIYRDWCCHVNQLGNDLLAESVAASLLGLPFE